MQELAKMLREKNLKVTPQRLAIFKLLSETKSHPSAETIYKSLEPDHPTMSLATVYKTLDALKKNQLIQEINVGENSFRYDFTTLAHPHVVCVSCGAVDDLECETLKHLPEILASETDYEIHSHQLFLYGKCKACQDISKKMLS